MHTSFWFDYSLNDFLFKGFSTHSVWGLIGLCLGIASFAFIFEYLRYLQAKQRQQELWLRSKQLRSICPIDTTTLLTGEETPLRSNINTTRLNRTCLFGADLGLWFSLLNIGYMLMLSVMAYNFWLFMSAVFGGGFGYFIFGQGFMKINLQNCQIIRDTWCMQICGEQEREIRDGESTPAVLEASTSGTDLHCHQVVANVHAECHK